MDAQDGMFVGELRPAMLGSLRPASPRQVSRVELVLCGLVLAGLAMGGCAGHAASTRDARHALDRGDLREALHAYNEKLGVKSAGQQPSPIEPDQFLYLLDRSVVLQSLSDHEHSSRDLEAADKGIEMLDFARSTTDDIGKFLFSDDSGPYTAPPYEKLMINTMNMMNYLARGDLNGAKVEARRFAVMQKYLSEHAEDGRGMLGPGSYLAGFTFERANEPGQALRFYDEALAFSRYDSLAGPVLRLCKRDGYSTPRLRELADAASASEGDLDSELGDLLVVINYGRVPAKIANRVPIGLALTIAADAISPADRARANKLAAQGLVTWVNYPSLGKPRGEFGRPTLTVDGKMTPTEQMLAVDVAARLAWKDVQGQVIGSAIVRTLSRLVAGEAAKKVSGGGVFGTLLSLGTQATLSATDTPDTRSWATLPARIAIGRLRVPPGKHTIAVTVRGRQQVKEVEVKPRGWATAVVTVLR